MSLSTTAIAGNLASDASYTSQMEGLTKQGEADMFAAAKMQNELNRANTEAKIMEAGPKAAKDLIS